MSSLPTKDYQDPHYSDGIALEIFEVPDVLNWLTNSSRQKKTPPLTFDKVSSVWLKQTTQCITPESVVPLVTLLNKFKHLRRVVVNGGAMVDVLHECDSQVPLLPKAHHLQLVDFPGEESSTCAHIHLGPSEDSWYIDEWVKNYAAHDTIHGLCIIFPPPAKHVNEVANHVSTFPPGSLRELRFNAFGTLIPEDETLETSIKDHWPKLSYFGWVVDARFARWSRLPDGRFLFEVGLTENLNSEIIERKDLCDTLDEIPQFAIGAWNARTSQK